MQDTICLCNQCGHSFQPNLQMVNEDRDRFESELSRHDHEIDKLRMTLAALEKGRDDLLQTRAKTLAAASSVGRLPAELLGEIFSWCAHLPERSEAELARTHRRQEKIVTVLTLPILNIAQTCRRWRQISLSRPKFWTDIVIRFDTMYELSSLPLSEEIQSLLDLLMQYLGYSKSLPLTIDIHAFGPLASKRRLDRINSHPFLIAMCCILSVLSSEMFRWQKVIAALDRDLLERYSDLLPAFGTENTNQNMPLLESFSIIFDEFNDSIIGEDWQPSLSVQLHSAVPQLRQLFIPHAPVDSGISYFPWSQLTSLTINSLQDDSCEFLEHCSKLESFRILHYSCGDSFPSGHPFLLPRLTNLEICMSIDAGSSEPDIDNRLDLFVILTLPSLSSLIITADSLDPDSVSVPIWNHDAFVDMMEHGFRQKLKRLSISDIVISREELQDVLSMTPSLTHFSHSFPLPEERHPVPHLIGYITNVLPHLTHLELFLPRKLDDKILTSICSMLESSKLECFKLRVLPDTDFDGLECMSRFDCLAKRAGHDYSIFC